MPLVVALASSCGSDDDASDERAHYCSYLCEAGLDAGCAPDDCHRRCMDGNETVPAACVRALDALVRCIGDDADRRVECRGGSVLVGPAEGRCTAELDRSASACS